MVAGMACLMCGATIGGARRASSLAGASRDYEMDLMLRGFSHVIGVDEAGRGPLAGPVVAGAVCCLNPSAPVISLAADSKKLTDAKRRKVVDELLANPRDYAVAVISIPHDEIDRINILQATMCAMRLSIEEVVTKVSRDNAGVPFYAIVDGNKTPAGLSIPARPLVRGDALCYSIALASCVAKVARDDMMDVLDEKYPLWNFATNKGYPTAEHVRLIGLHGPSPIHRMTFKPLKGRNFTVPLISSPTIDEP